MLLRPFGLLLLPLVLLQACSSTPFGQQLADSFDAPAPAPVGASDKPQAATQGRPPAEDQAAGAAAKPNAQPTPKPEAKPVVTPVSPPTSPQPYRITLRLSSADPAAPAEQVTRSLREAGIPFEVETIERIEPPDRLSVSPEKPGAKP